MTIPMRKDEFENRPPRRPAGAGGPEERTDSSSVSIGKNSWKSRFPGWETYEGRPNDPRFEPGADLTHDSRYDTNLNPSAVVPRRLGLLFYVFGAVLGFLLLVGVGLLLFYQFMEPAPRAPETPEGMLRSTPVATNSRASREVSQSPGNVVAARFPSHTGLATS